MSKFSRKDCKLLIQIKNWRGSKTLPYGTSKSKFEYKLNPHQPQIFAFCPKNHKAYFGCTCNNNNNNYERASEASERVFLWGILYTKNLSQNLKLRIIFSNLRSSKTIIDRIFLANRSDLSYLLRTGNENLMFALTLEKFALKCEPAGRPAGPAEMVFRLE